MALSEQSKAEVMERELKFAPHHLFDQILEYCVIPTFDLVIQMPDGRVLLVRRKLAPYANKWALPGLRMFKPESIEDTLLRIAKQEVGLEIDPHDRTFLGQYVGRFKTEHDRQDLSTGYLVKATSSQVKPNDEHFSGLRLISSADQIPSGTGAMYVFYLRSYFAFA